MDIKILVAAHKKAEMPNDDIYMPVHVGKACHPDMEFGYQADDEGENISIKNPYYCELTAIYWAWKNLNADYIGLAHYRRHFSMCRSKHDIRYVVTKEQLLPILEKYDVIVPCKRHYYIESLYSHYGHTHDIEHLNLTRSIISNLCSEYLIDFDVVMKRTSGHLFNMMIMRRDRYDEYCGWLFPILSQLEKQVDVSQMSAFDARLFGRVSELLLDVWLRHNKIKYKEVPMMQIGDVNWTKKIIGFLGAKFMGRKYSQSK